MALNKKLKLCLSSLGIISILLVVIVLVIEYGVSTEQMTQGLKYGVYVIVCIAGVAIMGGIMYCLWCRPSSKAQSSNVEAALSQTTVQYNRLRPSIEIYTDACKTGGGAFCKDDNDWLYIHWRADEPNTAKEGTVVWEFSAIKHAVQRWAPRHKGFLFQIYSDNNSAVSVLNGDLDSSNATMRENKREVDEVLSHNDVRVEGSYIQGDNNETADLISRLSTPGNMNKLKVIMGASNQDTKRFIKGHMSSAASKYF